MSTVTGTHGLRFHDNSLIVTHRLSFHDNSITGTYGLSFHDNSLTEDKSIWLSWQQPNRRNVLFLW